MTMGDPSALTRVANLHDRWPSLTWSSARITISEYGVPAAEDPRSGSSCHHCVYFEGTEGPAEEILTPAPDVPPDPPIGGGAG